MDEYNNVVIETENDLKKEYSVLAIFEVGGQNYVALLPAQDDGSEEIVFFGCNENAELQELEIIEIEEEEEFAVVSEAFLNLMKKYAEQ